MTPVSLPGDAGVIVPGLTAWWAARPDVAAVALVGSFARGTARPDSDVDLVLLVADPAVYRADAAWVAALPWAAAGVTPQTVRDADYGPLWSRFVTLDSGRIVEFGFAAPAWAATDALDPGTAQVVGDGCRILYDPQGLLARLVAAVAAGSMTG